MYESEAALCAAYIKYAKTLGFTVYPETGGWDMVLERRGLLVGVEAKLRLNYHALRQAVERNNVDLKVVLFDLTPERKVLAKAQWLADFNTISLECRVIGVRTRELAVKTLPHTFALVEDRWGRRRPLGYHIGRSASFWLTHYLHFPAERVWLPPLPADVEAGVKSPQSVGQFQIACIKLERIYDRRGWVSIYDARRITEEESGNWNARTMLAHHFRCTNVRLKKKRGNRWVVKWRPSVRWPKAAACLPAVEKKKRVRKKRRKSRG